ncbi:MAG: VOC family protein [Candidatus Dependentiae bacterium]|nr:VOC family protein [Candidatus Dependentiae bacterium]
MFTKITHISLFVHDQDAALDFYTKLGFAVHTDALFGTLRWLTLHLPEVKDMELALLKAETEQEKALVGKQAGDKPFISLESNDCVADYERLKTLNVLGLEKPETQPWGISFGFKDLYGNIIYVCQPH